MTTHSFRRVLTAGWLFTLGALAGKAIGFVMLPILTRALDPVSYGRLDVLTTLASGLTSVLLFGLDTAAMRVYLDRTSRTVGILVTWFVLSSAISGAAAISLIIAAEFLATVLFGDVLLAPAIAASGLVVSTATLHHLGLTILRIQFRALLFAAVVAGTLSLYALLTLVGVSTLHTDVTFVLMAHATSLTVASGAVLYSVRHALSGVPNRRAAKELLRVGLPLAPGVAAVWIGEFAYRAIVLGAQGASAVATLSVALRFASVINLAAIGIQMAWYPHAFSLAGSEAAQQQLRREARWIIEAICLLTVVTVAAAPEALMLLAGPSYASAGPVIGWTSTMALLAAVFQVSMLSPLLTRRTSTIAVANAIGVAGSIVLVAILAPALGAAGAGVGLLLGQALMIVTLVWTNHGGDPLVSLDWLPSIAAALVLTIAFATIFAESLPARLAIACAVGGVGVLRLADLGRRIRQPC